MGDSQTNGNVPQLNKGNVAISKDKKQHLVAFMQYIDPYFYRFYEEVIDEQAEDEDPDIELQESLNVNNEKNSTAIT